MYNEHGREHHSVFFKAMMTGLFVGIIDTLICLGYNIFYRYESGFFPSEIINVSSIIFMVNLLMLVVGLVYFCFLKFAGGNTVYVIFILALTAFLAWKSATLVRFGDSHMDGGFHGLLTGMVLILGISASLIPVLYNHEKFLDNVI
jgi:hypothetical protein